ncbi:unnamed protein product [Linum trigynum]|uniref:Uncharacterized protein n=1 Tax=Linum trigynum TaxID=586398 RepID=A0AAV2FFA2_9ROSI
MIVDAKYCLQLIEECRIICNEYLEGVNKRAATKLKSVKGKEIVRVGDQPLEALIPRSRSCEKKEFAGGRSKKDGAAGGCKSFSGSCGRSHLTRMSMRRRVWAKQRSHGLSILDSFTRNPWQTLP